MVKNDNDNVNNNKIAIVLNCFSIKNFKTVLGTWNRLGI